MSLTHPLLEPIRKLHAHIQTAVVTACEQASLESLSAVVREAEGDTIYAVDRVSEELLIDFFEREVANKIPIVLIAEGLPGGQVVLPEGAAAETAVWRIIVDPIDGTRGLMYQKRSGWILTAVAPNRGPHTNLQDIELAVQTEIPLVKQHLADSVWAVQGQGVAAVRYNRLTGQETPIQVRPSRATTIAHGFAMIARFFPGARAELAAIDEEIVLGALGPVQPGKAHCFEDQYICTGGQLYELMAGKDRFVADIRPYLEPLLAQQNRALGICCHPYDICTALIAEELGVIITDASGQPLNHPLDVSTNVGWVGYANVHIQKQIEPLFQKALRRRQLLPATKPMPVPANGKEKTPKNCGGLQQV
ncbi:inositol monophosphatase [Candidatus Leptofilum sp.]|uniref:inositol monophosphatase n=1 Tax=Candidatus Leptofilum sp. TaxID=3241576 RepID=UPI003B5996B3